MPQNSQHEKRRSDNFERWWRKNHHRSRAHKWLVQHAKRIAYAYNLHPNHFDDIVYIGKRFHKSEYQRLRYADAWCLWKAVHPLPHRRLERLEQTAQFLLEQKAAKTDKKPVIVERKPTRVIKMPTRTV